MSTPVGRFDSPEYFSNEQRAQQQQQQPQPQQEGFAPEYEMDERRSSNTADTLNNDAVQQPPGGLSYNYNNGNGNPNRYSWDKGHSLNRVPTARDHLTVPGESALSPNGGSRAEASRMNDDLELLRIERAVSNAEHELHRSKTKRQHQPEPEDLFAGNPGLEQEEEKRPPSNEKTAVGVFFFLKYFKKVPRCFRYLIYLLPGAGLLLIPILMGVFEDEDDETVIGGDSGLPLMWFGIWLMILYCTLWGTRMVTSLMPVVFRFVAVVLGSNNGKKWKDVGRNLELHTALFLWMLISLITFRTIVDTHREPDNDTFVQWIDIVGKVLIAFFVLAVLNWIEKICIQWIATSFHMRTYSQRIQTNRSDVHHLVHLYDFAKERVTQEDPVWGATSDAMGAGADGARTPMAALQTNVRQAFNKAGVVANRVGNDFIGRKGDFNHSKKIVTELLRTTASSHSLARLIYRSLVNPANDTIYLEDMQAAFKEVEEAEHAFGIFDKDFNGDISMEEMECVCNEIHLERKAIAASLKDLDSVIKKLDRVFFTIIFIIAIIVFITILSESAAAGLASAGTAVLGLAWMLQATAQEFLQSIIFVFVKHPFDVGDRVTIYGNTGTSLTGDDYYVTEISLLYTEFKKMEGHIVQAPNSILNNLFILNQRRSSGLADVVGLNLGIKTDPLLIEELKARMVEYCLANKRDFQPRVLTEVTTINDVQSFSMNFIFFHKSNFQNELLRLTRHNKFVAQLMVEIRDLGMQGPWQVQPGGSRETPVHWASCPPPPSYDSGAGGGNGNNGGVGATGTAAGGAPGVAPNQGPAVSMAPLGATTSSGSNGSVQRSAVRQIPTIEENFTDFQDVFESRKPAHTPHISRLQSIREQNAREGVARSSQDRDQQERDQENASASGAAFRPSIDSHSSQRRNMWGRPRSKSQVKPQEMV